MSSEIMRKTLQLLERHGVETLEPRKTAAILRNVGVSEEDTDKFLQSVASKGDGMISPKDFVYWVWPEDVQTDATEEGDTLGHELRGVSVHHLNSTLMKSVHTAGQDRHAKVYEIEPTVIRPTSQDSICPRDFQKGAAYVDVIRGKEHAGLSTFMLSYTWGYAIGDIVDTLVQHCHDKCFGPAEVFVWMCCLCINQHRVKEAQAAGQVIPFERFEAEFGSRVCGIGQIVAMMSPWHSPFYLKRVWCNFEMYTAVAKRDQVEMNIVMPPHEMEDFRQALLENTGIDRVWKACNGVRVEDAQASIPNDRDRILEMIRTGPGFDVMNSTIVKHLQTWMVDCSEGYLRQNLATENLDTDSKLKLCSTVNKMLRNIGKQSQAESILAEALRIHEQAGTLESLEGADLLRQIGILRRRDFQHAEALELFEKAQRIHERTSTMETDKGALLLLNLGLVRAEQEEYSTALSVYQQAMEVAVKADLVRTNIGSMILRESAFAKESLGDLQGARADYSESLQILRDTDSLATPAAAKLFACLGGLMLKTQELDSALDNFAQAKRIRDSTNCMTSKEGAVLMRCYGDALQSTGNIEAAREAYDEGARICKDLGLLESSEGKLVRQRTSDLKAMMHKKLSILQSRHTVGMQEFEKQELASVDP
mmetsp:Transcript_63049/g.112030  ORF Transcript_63049/g.112030 Transcript_63049/m.112030 type:complete len:651 (-) Transcript_63049:90-2042(-)